MTGLSASTASNASATSHVIAAIRHHAAANATTIALNDGEETLTYAVLLTRAEALAAAWQAQGVRRLAVRMDNGIAWCVADIATIMAGIISVPLPPFFTPAQCEHAMQSAGVDHRLHADGSLQRCAYPVTVLPAGTQKITYTSGTTSAPKGVCLSQAGMEAVSHALITLLGAKTAARHLALLPLAVLLENIAGLYPTLLAGGCYHVPPLSALGFLGMQPDGAAILHYIAHARVTSIILVPELLRVLVAALARNPQPLPDLAFVAVGGAKLSPSLLAQAHALGLPVYEGYGLSEAASVVALNTPLHHMPGTVGKLLPHVRATFSPTGELILASPALLGYVGEAPHRGAFATGDVVAMDADGFLTIQGRRRNVLITAYGRNISPEWPESELCAEPEIAQALVVGEGQSTLAALIVPNASVPSVAASASLSPSSATTVAHNPLRAAIGRANARLPEYARIHAWRVVPPFTAANGMMTPNARPVRAAIMEQYAPDIQALYAMEEINPMENTQPMMPFFDRLRAETEAERQALYDIPIIRDALRGAISKESYIAFLTQAYHHVKHTTPLLMATGARLPEKYEWLREAVAEYIEEEVGHQEWILNDIEACGGDKEAARRSVPHFATEMMVAYAYDTVHRINPLAFFGMVFVLEGTSTALATQAAEKIGAALKLSKKCFTYLNSHGALDISHMEFFQKLMNRLESAEDQAAILHMAKRMFVLYGNVFRSLPHTQEAKHAA